MVYSLQITRNASGDVVDIPGGVCDALNSEKFLINRYPSPKKKVF